MNNDAIGVFAFFLGTGFLCLLLWLAIRTGYWKGWWTRTIPSSPVAWGITPYLALPFSTLLFAMSTTVLLPNVEMRRNVFTLFSCLGLPSSLFASGYIFIVQPRWWLPGWLCYLHDYHPDIIDLLQDEAGRMGAKEWGRRVSTQEGLEEWVEEVRQKHRL